LSQEHYIIDTPLPLNQDFKGLKNKALEFIQAIAGKVWTNLNASDPGVTILDQVCYALTELGYCNDFPVKDLLTKANGKLLLKDQFYQPEEIFTTAPVTASDYIKYLVDTVNGVRNAVILPVASSLPTTSAGPWNRPVYQAYLYTVPASPDLSAAICSAAYYSLNKARNLGDWFLMPVALRPAIYTISGTLSLKNEQLQDQALVAIQTAIEEYIFPQVNREGYPTLKDEGISNDTIFNGPKLKNGWIVPPPTGEIKHSLTLAELTAIIESVNEVASVSLNGFWTLQNAPAGASGDQQLLLKISAEMGSILSIDLQASVYPAGNAAQPLVIYCNNVPVPAAKTHITRQNEPPAATPLVYGTAGDDPSVIPQGTYRDLDAYYSIQHTMPAIFGLESDTLNAADGDTRTAQSRQLRAYLSLMDQVLANQFAQLANLGRLFSFRNTLSGIPSQVKEYYATLDRLGNNQRQRPAPFVTFAPTYFYHSLYDAPHIKPLLKNNKAFDFSNLPEAPRTMSENGWRNYQFDPYNAYMRGLLNLMEDDSIDFPRRNALLDHLLARHGESPQTINRIIEGVNYSGLSIEDKIVFKSLYLQNLGLLGYYRQKAYNYESAFKLNGTLEPLSSAEIQWALEGDALNFILNATQLEQSERLSEQHFINYSGLELKLNLLMGLKTQYRSYLWQLFTGFNNTANPYCGLYEYQKAQIVSWLIHQRRGLILIETRLLFRGYSGPEAERPSQSCLKTDIPDLVLVFPDFVPQVNSPAFKQSLAVFMEESLAADLSYRDIRLTQEELVSFIPAFALFHNQLIYNASTGPATYAPDQAQTTLITLLISKLNNGS
jgi:hypothetical protein